MLVLIRFSVLARPGLARLPLRRALLFLSHQALAVVHVDVKYCQGQFYELLELLNAQRPVRVRAQVRELRHDRVDQRRLALLPRS